MDPLRDITDAVRTIVKLMVDSPQDVHVECHPVEGGACLSIIVASEDLGQSIGQRGRTVRALRVLVSAMGMVAEQRISLDLQE